MNKTIAFLALLLWPLSVWSMKPIADSDLSCVSSPASLGAVSVRTPDVRPGEDGCEAGREDAAKGEASLFSVSWEDKDAYLDIPGLQEAKNKEADAGGREPAATVPEYSKGAVTPSGSTPGMAYPNGQTAGSDTPIIIDHRPYGQEQLRIYYTDDTSSWVLPNSWVDIQAR